MQKDDPVISGLESYSLAFDEIIVDIVAHGWMIDFLKGKKCGEFVDCGNLYTFSYAWHKDCIS